jgi:hypothetical protein
MLSFDSSLGEKSEDSKKPCNNINGIIGDCFTFEGRASLFNGNPSLRIWRIGTKRILGVYEIVNETTGEEPCIPENLKKAIDNNFAVEVYGEFTVCPLTKAEPGVMQTVCVDSVKISKVVNLDNE